MYTIEENENGMTMCSILTISKTFRVAIYVHVLCGIRPAVE